MLVRNFFVENMTGNENKIKDRRVAPVLIF